jgi:2,3-dihydro-2,3-dihydroxybenzoate dehydrogenase
VRALEFTGQTALVSGAGSGIGRALAHALSRSGAYVIAAELSEHGLAGLTEDRARGSLIGEVRSLDVGDAEAVRALVDQVERTRPIGLLVNVAGVLDSRSVLELDAEGWRRVFRTNADGVFHVSQAVARHMTQRGAGAIVTVSSNAARTPRVQMAAYAASKASASMFTKCLGLELASSGVRCNVVSPGSTDTPMLRGMWSDRERGAERVVAGTPAAFRVGIPLGRIGSVDDVVEGALFLLSERARHITMHELVIDGGATLGC